ncbi:hypothetical protein ACFQ68_13565 [Amycolatopsis japonica]|uniref:hypothetical protein n=1 Tax=Amycolatopsis japonica TaxID=208439 RepID=UPI00366F32D2
MTLAEAIKVMGADIRRWTNFDPGGPDLDLFLLMCDATDALHVRENPDDYRLDERDAPEVHEACALIVNATDADLFRAFLATAQG